MVAFGADKTKKIPYCKRTTEEDYTSAKALLESLKNDISLLQI